INLGVLKCLTRGRNGELRCHLAGRSNPPFPDTRALHDPVIRCVDRTREFVVAQHALGQIAAATQNDRTEIAHDGASLMAGSGAGTFLWWRSVSLIFASSP